MSTGGILMAGTQHVVLQVPRDRYLPPAASFFPPLNSGIIADPVPVVRGLAPVLSGIVHLVGNIETKISWKYVT